MTEYKTTDLERENLSAHVDLCSMRYQQLDARLTIIEHKVDAVSRTIAENNNSMRSVIIAAATGLITSVLGLITTILLKF